MSLLGYRKIIYLAGSGGMLQCRSRRAHRKKLAAWLGSGIDDCASVCRHQCEEDLPLAPAKTKVQSAGYVVVRKHNKGLYQEAVII